MLGESNGLRSCWVSSAGTGAEGVGSDVESEITSFVRALIWKMGSLGILTLSAAASLVRRAITLLGIGSKRKVLARKMAPLCRP